MDELEPLNLELEESDSELESSISELDRTVSESLEYSLNAAIESLVLSEQLAEKAATPKEITARL